MISNFTASSKRRIEFYGRESHSEQFGGHLLDLKQLGMQAIVHVLRNSDEIKFRTYNFGFMLQTAVG